MICTWPAGDGKPCGAARVAAKDILSRIFLTYWMMNGSRSWRISAWIGCESGPIAEKIYFTQSRKGPKNFEQNALRELPKNNLRILLALLPVFYVVTTGT